MKRKKEKTLWTAEKLMTLRPGGYAEILEMYTANYRLKAHITWHTS
jgi:hypothetical protein